MARHDGLWRPGCVAVAVRESGHCRTLPSFVGHSTTPGLFLQPYVVSAFVALAQAQHIARRRETLQQNYAAMARADDQRLANHAPQQRQQHRYGQPDDQADVGDVVSTEHDGCWDADQRQDCGVGDRANVGDIV